MIGAVKKIATELKIQGKSDKTVKAYTYYVRDFLNFSGKIETQVETDDVKAYLAHRLADRKNDAATVALARSAIKFYFDGMLGMGVTSGIKTPKKVRRLPTVLTKQEMKKLLKSSGNLRNRLLIEFMYSSGLRVAELAKLSLKDLDIKERTGLIKEGKGGKDRFFILSRHLCNSLIDYIRHSKANSVDLSKFLFPGRSGSLHTRSILKIVHKAGIEAKLNKKVYCHLLRHTFATHLLEADVDIRLIQELLAHSNLQTTQFYTKVSVKKLKEVRSPLDDL